jgi:hypothetical protein
MEVKFDREALKKVISELKVPSKESDWCIACGAGSASQKLQFPEELVKQIGVQLTEPQALRELVSTLRANKLEDSWCIACGAGAKASPLDMVTTPREVTDEFIDALSQKLIGTVKVQ